MFDRCLYFNTNHLSRVVNKLWAEAYAPLGLAPAHSYLLRLVLEKEGLTQTQITDMLHLEKSTVSRFIDKMVKEGYLTRQTSAKKQSSAEIYPTDKARAIKDELNDIGNRLYQQMQTNLNKEDLMQLVSMIKLAIHRIED